MTESMNQQLKSLVVARRIISALSLVVPCICIYLLLSGFISFWGRDLNIVAAFNGLFEVFAIGRRSLLYCVSSTAVSVVYSLAIAKIVIAVISILKDIKGWLIAADDTQISRRAAKQAIFHSNSSLWWLFVTFSVSHALNAVSIRGTFLIVFVALILFNAILSAVKNLLFYEQTSSGIIKSINYGMILIALLLFSYFVVDTQISAVWEGFSLMTLGSKYLPQIIVQNILQPVFGLITIFSLLYLSYEANRGDFYDSNYYANQAAKRLLIHNAVFLCISVLFLGFINRYMDIKDYLQLAYQNIVLVLVTGLIGVITINQITLQEKEYIQVKKASDAEETDADEPADTLEDAAQGD